MPESATPRGSRSRPHALTRAAAALVAAVCITAVIGSGGSPAQGQERGEDRSPVRLDVETGDGWFGPERPLELSISLTSTSRDQLSDLRVTVALHDRARSRSRLAVALESEPPRAPLEAFTYDAAALPPRASQTIQISQPMDSLRSFRSAPDGVYPLSVTVRRKSGPAILSVVTAVAFVSSAPTTPITVVPLVVVAPPPLTTPDGEPLPGRIGALNRSLDHLSGAAGGLAVAVSPLLLRELDTLRSGASRQEAERALAGLRTLAGKGEVVALPHTYAQLPHLAELGGSRTALESSLDRAAALTSRYLETTTSRVVYPPRLALDADVVDDLEAWGASAAFAPQGAMAGLAGGLTPAELVSYRGLTLIPADDGIRRKVTSATSELHVGRALADAAMTYFESPNRERVIGIVVPAGETQARVPDFLSRLAAVPWAVSVLPSQLAGQDARRLRSLPLPPVADPPRAYARALDAGRAAVVRIRALAVSDNEVTSTLGLALDGALGTAWWSGDWDAGTARSRAVASTVRELTDMIRAIPSGPVTFTSRRGQVPISITNGTGFPVRLRVEVDSPKLQFPEGSARTITSLAPPGALITFPALADATGTFPLTVRVASADGSVVLGENELVVRSTAYNLVALVLTIGAALFIVGWYGLQLLRRRREEPAAASAQIGVQVPADR